MKILVTGGNGFIATNFIITALKRDYQVFSIDNLGYAGSQNNNLIFDGHKNFTFIKEDIRNKTIEKLIEKERYDAILNFAAESHVDRSIHNDFPFISTNINGTHNLLSICKKLLQEKVLSENFRFIQISTDEVYGSLASEEAPFTELSHLDPSNPYSATKAASDVICLSYYKTYNFPTIVTRCSNNYGPFQYPEKLIPLCINKINTNNKIPIYGDGKQIRDWIHVSDHCQGIIKALEEGEIGNVYNFGGKAELTNIECIKSIIEILRPNNEILDFIEFVEDRPGHDKRYAIDSSKSQKDLNWKTQYNFKSGIRATVEWYEENKVWLTSTSSTKDFRIWEELHY